MSHFIFTNGDGTVTTRSATNGRNSNIVTIPNGNHTAMLNNTDALNAMRNLIIASTGQNNELLDENLFDIGLHVEERDISNYTSVVVQGLISLDIYDSYGNRLIQEGGVIYRQVFGGVREQVGQVFPINHETKRYQFVLNSYEYIFRNIVLDDNLTAEIMVIGFESWLKTSWLHFTASQLSDQMELTVSINESSLVNIAFDVAIEAHMIISSEYLEMLNESTQNIVVG